MNIKQEKTEKKELKRDLWSDNLEVKIHKVQW